MVSSTILLGLMIFGDPSSLSGEDWAARIRLTEEHFQNEYSAGYTFEVEEWTTSRISGITSKPRARALRIDFAGEKRRVVMGSIESGPATVLVFDGQYGFDIGRELHVEFGLQAYQPPGQMENSSNSIEEHIAFYYRIFLAGLYVIEDKLADLLLEPTTEVKQVQSITSDEVVLHLAIKESNASVRLKRLSGYWYVSEVEKRTPDYAKWVQENSYRIVEGLLCPEKVTLETVALRRAGSVNQRWEFQPPRRFSDPDSVFTLAHYGVEAPEVFGEDVRFGMSRRWRWLLTGNVAALAILIGIAWTVQRWRRTRPDSQS